MREKKKRKNLHKYKRYTRFPAKKKKKIKCVWYIMNDQKSVINSKKVFFCFGFKCIFPTTPYFYSIHLTQAMWDPFPRKLLFVVKKNKQKKHFFPPLSEV